MKRVFYNAEVITPERILHDGYVMVDNGKIAKVGTGFRKDGFDGEMINAGGTYLAPGFIDIHVHGGGGHDFMDGTKEAYLQAAKMHAKFGTTALLPTTLTSTNEELKNTFRVFEEVKDVENDGAKMLGLHLEGPYFAPQYAGAQDPRYIKSPSRAEYEEIYEWSKGNIIRWSAAPELPGSDEFGSFLKEKGICASIGHSGANEHDCILAYENGFNHITHMYCAMSTIVRNNGYRSLGVIESAYLIDGMTVEIIADGCHLPKGLLQLVYKSKGADRTALCTDAMRGAGMPEGESILGSLKDGQKVTVKDGVAFLNDFSAFAGSVCTADRLIRTMVNLAEVPLTDAVKMMTLTPARIIKMDQKKGSIAMHKDADLVLFDSDIDVKMTMVEGRIVYQK